MSLCRGVVCGGAWHGMAWCAVCGRAARCGACGGLMGRVVSWHGAWQCGAVCVVRRGVVWCAVGWFSVWCVAARWVMSCCGMVWCAWCGGAWCGVWPPNASCHIMAWCVVVQCGACRVVVWHGTWRAAARRVVSHRGVVHGSAVQCAAWRSMQPHADGLGTCKNRKKGRG